ncbi:hypothetical protein H6G41_19735 [Tolypothrix sp. FACHB-123]|uniref:hypothetical protein n=1 Tax=Tolypothrix sp. FACHB-123 TaxID=2692868 RepID=UPI001681D49A|nr:hypothetical protein [Tolypothrix sp. FACHB-123]MBD2356831.1 hypothetical protein [Tolypothrix sp. FACHB-123]
MQARSLIETTAATFSLHPLVMEYVNFQLIPENNPQIKHNLLLEQKHQLQIAS